MSNFLTPFVFSLGQINDLKPFEEFDSIFRSPFQMLSSKTLSPLVDNKNSLPVDIIDNGETYEVRVPVAGLNKDNIKINLDGRRLTINYTNSDEKTNYYLKESIHESISRSVILPVDMDEQNVSKATITDGILKFTMGKTKSVKTNKTIAIE